jgi:hypothetical protein
MNLEAMMRSANSIRALERARPSTTILNSAIAFAPQIEHARRWSALIEASRPLAAQIMSALASHSFQQTLLELPLTTTRRPRKHAGDVLPEAPRPDPDFGFRQKRWHARHD